MNDQLNITRIRRDPQRSYDWDCREHTTDYFVELVGSGLDFTLRDGMLYVICADDDKLADPGPFIERRLEAELDAQGKTYLFSREFANAIAWWIARDIREGRI